MEHANLVSFTCLKALAFDQRFERKDAHDLIYCIKHAPEGLDGAVAAFRKVLTGKHREVIRESLSILRRRFAFVPPPRRPRKLGRLGIKHSIAVCALEAGEGPSGNARER